MKTLIIGVFLLIAFINSATHQAQNKNIDPKQGTIAYKAKIESEKDGILKLSNGAIIEIDTAYLGYVGYRKNCVLYRSGYGCKIWIESKRLYDCNLLKAPVEPYLSKPENARQATISKAKSNNTILILDDGSIYEVDAFNSYDVILWLNFHRVLILNDVEMINLDRGDSTVTVSRIDK